MTITYQFVWQPSDTTGDPGFQAYVGGTLEEAIDLAKCYRFLVLTPAFWVISFGGTFWQVAVCSVSVP